MTVEDLLELSTAFPKLNCSPSHGMIWGTLDIDCSYDEGSQELVFNDQFENPICDCYEIRMDFNMRDTFGFPVVFEDSGKIEAFSKEAKISMGDLHLNSENSACCLGIYPEYQWRGATAYIQDKVIPFLYWQSYRRTFGKPPWPGYSHGIAGIQQAMTMTPAEATKGCSRNKMCPCGSNKKYKKCCMERDAILMKKLTEKKV